MRRFAYFLTFLVAFGIFGKCYAQTSFYDGFETPAEIQNWTLNHGPSGQSLTNKWFVSAYEPYMGDNCLIISSDNGATAVYADKKNTAVAYREYQLPPGTYDLSFNWRCVGEDTKDALYACWTPSSIDIKSSMAGMAGTVNTYALKCGKNNSIILNGSSQWLEASATVTVAGSGTAPVSYRLYFIWDNNAAVNNAPSACVDNIQIASTACPKPTNISVNVTGNTARLSWLGNSSSYEVQYRAYGSPVINTIPNITKNNVTIPNIPPGVYDFFVKGDCGGSQSVSASKQNVLIYQSDVSCINFIDLDAAECRTGTFNNPNAQIEKVDNGPDDMSSRHTLNYIPGMRDPWSTGGMLSTIPPGEMVSIRLGNPYAHSEQESVTYDYYVNPAENVIMLLKYAVVFEEPGHSEENVFTLEILDENGNLLKDSLGNDECSLTEFHAKNDPTWNKSTSSVTNYEVSWKDWTTVGVNLTPYRGRNIKIRVSTFDCGWSGHYTYAYYNISCAKAALSGFSCGDVDSFAIEAPDGFDYKWYRPEDPSNIIYTGRDFSIPASQADTFYCDIIFKENPDCYFTLPAYLVPRNPKSRFTPEWSPKDCTNKLLLRNTGGVESDGRLTSEKCEYTEWLITDISTGKDTVITDQESPMLDFPDRGDTINIRLVSYISGGLCSDTFYVNNYIVPRIGPTDVTVDTTICQGQLPFVFSGEKYYSAGVYSNRNNPEKNKSVAGCDSFVTLDLKILDKLEAEVFDTICQGDTAWLSGRPYVRTGEYMATVKSALGCDSVITLHLTVMPDVVLTFDPVAPVCADAENFSVQYRLAQGDITSYSVLFGQDEKAQGFVDQINVPVQPDSKVEIPMPEQVPVPNNYRATVVFYREKCDSVKFDFPFLILYPTDGVMVQKWNDVIALLNPEHNYGQFEYDSYQWFKNNQPVEGADGDHIYIGGNGSEFSSADEYSVMLVRKGETLGIMSCPLIPADRSSKKVSDYVTVSQMAVGQKVCIGDIPSDGEALWYSISGQLAGKYKVESSSPSVTAPTIPGIYVLRLVFGSEISNYKILVQ